MAAAAITGTFTGTGNSSEIAVTRAVIDLTFVGAATVNLQWNVDGTNWRTIESYTSSTQKVFDAGVNVPIRLNCSAHTNNVAYAIRPQ